MGQASTKNGIHSDDKVVNKMSYEKMLTLSRSALITLNAELRLTGASSSIEQLTGYTSQKLIETPYLDLVVASYHQKFHDRLTQNQPAQFDYPLKHQDGHWVWIRHTSEKQADNSYQCMLQDISQYKASHGTVENERSLLRTIIDNLPAAIHATDTDGNFIFSNPVHADLLGQDKPDTILGQKGSDFLPEALSAHFEKQDTQVMTTGEVLITEELIRLDEQTQFWVNATKMPMHNNNGIIEGVIGITRDVSEQKHAQQQLSASEARNRALLNALPDMMFVVRRDGIITEFRSSLEVEALGVDETVIGTPFAEAGFPQALVDEAQLFLVIVVSSRHSTYKLLRM